MTQQKQNGKLIAIITMIFLFGMISFVTNLAAPMGIVLKNQFSVSNALGMLGNFGNFIAYAVMGIPSGILLQRVGYKKTALIAVAVGFIGVGIQYLSGHSSPDMAFAVYLIGAFIAGFSMCLLNTVVNPMLNKLGGEGNKGNQLIQVGGSFNSVMATITPMFVGILIAGSIEKATISQIFPVMYTAMAVFAIAFFVLLIVPIPEPNAATSTEPIGKLMSGALKFRHFILGAIAIFVYVGVEVGVPGTLNLFLTDPIEKGGAGISSTISGFVVGTYWFLMLIGRLAGASLGAKISSKAMLTFTSALGLLLVFLAIFSSTGSLVNLPWCRMIGRFLMQLRLVYMSLKTEHCTDMPATTRSTGSRSLKICRYSAKPTSASRRRLRTIMSLSTNSSISLRKLRLHARERPCWHA